MSGAILRALLGAVATSLAVFAATAAPVPDDGQGYAIAALAQSGALAGSSGFLDRLHERTSSPEILEQQGATGGFLSGYGDRTRWDDTARSRSWGLSAGFMTGMDEGLGAGLTLAAGTARHNIAASATLNRNLATEYLAALHARLGAPGQPFNLTLAAGHGWTSNDFMREGAGSGTLTARDVSARQWFASVALGHNWKPVDGFVLTGFARVDAARIRQDAYGELPLDGATLVPAAISAAEATSLRSLLGARTTLGLAAGRRGATLSIHAAWAHEFETDRSVGFSRVITDPLGGAPTTVTGVALAPRIDENSIHAGASVEAPVTDTARIYLGYNALFASSRDSQSAEAGLRVTW